MSIQTTAFVLAVGAAALATACGHAPPASVTSRATVAVASPAPVAVASRATVSVARQVHERRVMPTHPPPTEVVRDMDAIERRHADRREWIERMHRTAPGVDWRAIERANRARLAELRMELRRRKDYVPDTWKERGSANQAGRMHCAALGLDGVTLYAGSAHGGTWRGALDGSSWTPIGDNLWSGAHRLAVAAAPAETILALTYWGRLVYTQDQGMNWLTPAGLPADVGNGKNLFVDPTDRSKVFALLGRPTGMEIFRSTDGGVSFTSVRALGNVPADMWMDRIAGGTLWVLAGAELWSSPDQGGLWRLESTLGPGPYSDAVLAGSEAGSPRLYAALRSGGAWELRRSDGGGTWIREPDLADFWGQLEASMTDPDVVAKGGVEMFRSTTGGATWQLVNGWGDYYSYPPGRLHADIQGIDVFMIGGQETWFIGTDGGTYSSTDAARTVNNLSLQGLRVSQYYSTLTSRLDPSHVVAGSQDQGYQIASAQAPLLDFRQVISGDYGHLTSGDRTHEWVYSTYPGFILVQQGEAIPQLEMLDFPAGSRPQWLPGVEADPTNREAFYFLADRLWRYERDPFGRWTSYLETTTNFFAPLTALSIAPSDPSRRLVVNEMGTLWHSEDGGFNWTRSADPGPGAHYFAGSALEHSPDDPLVALVGGSGYSNPGIYRTADGGQTWLPFASGLPQTHVYDIAWLRPGSQVAFAATESGPYRLDPATSTWEHIGGLTAPLTTYWSVETIPEIGVARFGTYGRGIWDWQQELVAEAGRCADGVDNEGDGFTDCYDPDCASDAACRENCADGIDNDVDGDADCADADCATADTDGDRRTDCGGTDCAPADGTTWSVPGEVGRLFVATTGVGLQDVRLTWTDDQRLAAGAGTLHDVVFGSLDSLRPVGWPAGALCIGNDVTTLAFDHSMSGIPVMFYLVRAQNACGAGPWGSGDQGPARPTPACP